MDRARVEERRLRQVDDDTARSQLDNLEELPFEFRRRAGIDVAVDGDDEGLSVVRSGCYPELHRCVRTRDRKPTGVSLRSVRRCQVQHLHLFVHPEPPNAVVDQEHGRQVPASAQLATGRHFAERSSFALLLTKPAR